MKSSKSQCVHPWHGIDIDVQQNYRPCCKYRGSLGKSLDEYENNPELEQLKQELDQGLKPKGCQRCWDDEASGILSKRQIDWKYLFNEQEPQGSYKYVSMTFGNTCNLACRTCSSYASSGWIKEEQRLKEEFNQIVIYDHNDFFKSKQYKQDIDRISKEIEFILIAGGEPWVSNKEEHENFIDKLLPRADQISLSYTTNATKLPSDQMWDKFKQFKEVKFHLSIDGTGSVYEYLRYPGKWEEVLDNIKFYQEKAKQFNIKCNIGHTVSILNVWYVPEFIDWCLTQGFEKPYIGMVSYPEFYDISILPKHIKDTISAKLTRHNLNDIVLYMNRKVSNDEQYAMFIQATDKIDQSRSQKLEDSLLELNRILKE